MPISIKCLDCNTETTVSDSAAGAVAKCPKCGNYIRIPGERTARPSAPAKSGGIPVAPIVVFAVVLLAGGGGVAWYFGSYGPRSTATPEPAKIMAADAPAKTEDGAATGTATSTAIAKPPAAKVNPMPWADAPDSAIAVAGATLPSQFMQAWQTLTDQTLAQNAMLTMQWRALQAKSTDYFGVDLTNPKNFSATGIDIEKPITFSLLEFDAKSEPSGVVLSAGITSQDAAMTMIKRLAEKEGSQFKEDTTAQPTAWLVGPEAAVAVKDNRIFFYGGSREKNCAAQLRDFLTKKESNPVYENAGLKAALYAVDGAGAATLYVDLKAIIQHLPGVRPAILNDFRSFVAKGSAKDGVAGLNLFGGSRLLRCVKAGAPCRDILARVEKPLATITLSMEDPVGLLQYAGESNGWPNDAQVQAATGLALSDWSELLKGGNLGILFYPSEAMPPVSALGFLKVRTENPDKAQKAAVAIEHWLTMMQKSVPMLAQTKIKIAAGGDYIVFGTAAAQINGLPQSTGAPSWDPQYGNGELIGMELSIGDIIKHLNRVAPNLNVGSNLAFNENSRMNFALLQRGDSLIYKSDSLQASTAAVAVVAAIAIPNVLRSKMAANEIAAVANCRAYCQAQEIYHRTDYNNDGVLEYAQSLKGPYSLYETKTGTGDPGLIDKAFAEAEGNPSQNPAPKAGYCFKVLKAQGPDAVGGRLNYVRNANQMTLGYGLVAYPQRWDATGRNTYIVNSNGTVFQKDLGSNTAQTVESMTEFNPDRTWVLTQ